MEDLVLEQAARRQVVDRRAQWHADEQYVGSPRGMKAYTYLESGGQIASHMVHPAMLMAA